MPSGAELLVPHYEKIKIRISDYYFSLSLYQVFHFLHLQCIHASQSTVIKHMKEEGAASCSAATEAFHVLDWSSLILY